MIYSELEYFNIMTQSLIVPFCTICSAREKSIFFFSYDDCIEVMFDIRTRKDIQDSEIYLNEVNNVVFKICSN